MVHLGAQAVAGTGTHLGLIPAGTGNDVARYLDLPRKDPAAAADRVIASTPAPDRPRPRGLALVRHRAGSRFRRGGQRASQPDALAEGTDALQPGHPRRAPHVRADPVRPRPRRDHDATRRHAGRRRQRSVLRWWPPDHRGRAARRRSSRRGRHQADEQGQPGPHLPQAVQGHPREPPPVRAPPGPLGHRRGTRHRDVRRRRTVRRASAHHRVRPGGAEHPCCHAGHPSSRLHRPLRLRARRLPGPGLPRDRRRPRRPGRGADRLRARRSSASSPIHLALTTGRKAFYTTPDQGALEPEVPRPRRSGTARTRSAC